ncbi:MAG TPA: peptide deformylase [Termitinemataceae bacterium]|nr:peptide deformylase [Termitinemataceae bacterium]HOM22812.1 peptide deformylase [Termitinemataceae bacterium]HPP99753.1 peptide deformylase [Termitinemataceae bacterium]
MQIYTLGHEVLRQKALPVQDINDEIAALVKEMRETMYAGRGIGLAGPQVGLLQRIFVVHIEGDIPRVFINPSIIQTSPELTEYEEGCLSIPGLYGEVKRPEAVRIQAWNERGRPFTLDAEGLLARVIQHEYDHLEGILFIDRLSEPKRKKLLALYDKKLRA